MKAAGALSEYRLDQTLSLRILRLRDAEELFAAVQANRRHLRRWLPWLDSNTSAEDTRRYIRSTLELHATGSGSMWAIWYGHRIAGMAGYHPIDWQNRSVELGYWLDQRHTGKGIMTRCCRFLIDYAFDTLELNRVMIRVASENGPSQAVAKRLGMHQEGVLREAQWLYDHYVDQKVYSILTREWQRTFEKEVIPIESS